MWIILVTNLASHRDNLLSDIFNEKIENVSEKFISNFSTYRLYICDNIGNAKVYKSKSGAERLVKNVANTQNDYYKNKYSLVKGKHLVARKLTISEWNSIIDGEKAKLHNTYMRKLSKLEAKKSGYK